MPNLTTRARAIHRDGQHIATGITEADARWIVEHTGTHVPDTAPRLVILACGILIGMGLMAWGAGL